MHHSIIVSVLALGLASCAVQPKPLTTGSVANFASDKLARVDANQEPISGKITLYEAMARAIKYNLDFKVELYNEVLARRSLDTAGLDALPKLVSKAGYIDRNNDSGSVSSTLFSDRNKYQGDISLSWNILDLGLSYVRAKQASDEVLVAEERRRKIINRVIEDVRTAYWRAVSADRLVAGLRRLESRVSKAFTNAKALEVEGDLSPLTALTYQRELVEIQKRIQTLDNDLSVAKMQLAALMNVRPGTYYQLAQPKRRLSRLNINMSADEMTLAALENRPEIRDIQYKLRINEQEVKKAFLKLLPSANIFVDGNYNSDSFLLNTSWVGWGSKATWNLIQLFKYPAEREKIRAKEDLLDQRALAISMAIITQVHVSRARYFHARKLFVTSARHLNIQKGILKQIRESAAAEQASEQTLIREEMNTLASRVNFDIAYASLQNAYANIFSSMGLDPYGAGLSGNESVSELTAGLRSLWVERGDTSGQVRAKRSAQRFKASYAARKAKKVDSLVVGSISKTTPKSSPWKSINEGSKPKGMAIFGLPRNQAGWIGNDNDGGSN